LDYFASDAASNFCDCEISIFSDEHLIDKYVHAVDAAVAAAADKPIRYFVL